MKNIWKPSITECSTTSAKREYNAECLPLPSRQKALRYHSNCSMPPTNISTVKSFCKREELLGIHTDHSFIQKVMECHTEAKTAEELAELCGANSTVTFRRTFLRLFNCPVAQWLRQKRAEQVLKLLRTTHLPLSEIAEQCGFANQSYLSDFCKRNLGDTPVNIRRDRS